MNIRKIALSSAAAFGLVAALGLTPAFAHSRHPATPSENAQTDQLNQQSLAAAQGSNAATPAPGAMTPDQQGGTGGTSTMAPTSPAQNNTRTTAMPDQPAPGAAAPNAVTPNTTAPDTTPTPAPSPNSTSTMTPDNSAAPTAANQDPAAPQPASGIAPKTPQ